MLVVIVRGIAIGRPALTAGLGADFTGKGHDEDIAEVGDTGPVEVILCKAFDDAIGVVVAGTPVPSFVDVAWAYLYGAEGDTRPHEGMAMRAGADIGVDAGEEGGLGGGVRGVGRRVRGLGV